MSGKAFHIISKPIGPICNMDCTYCFYLEKENLYPAKRDFRMPDEVLERFIKEYIEAQDVPDIHFTWQGGEPTLLGLDFFEKVVTFQQTYANGKRIQNAFQTNGVNINPDWCDFFVQHNFLVGLSIDGPREYHDRYRVFKGGQSSFDKVMQAIQMFKKNGVEFNTLTCVNRFNSQNPLEIYHFLKETGSTFMQFIPIVERKGVTSSPEGISLIHPAHQGEGLVTEWSVEPEQYGQFLISIFEEWVRNDVGKVFIQLFEVAVQIWYGLAPTLCVFRETCGKALAIEHIGDLYSCDHYVYPEYLLGNIQEQPLSALVYSEIQQKFGQDKKDTLPRYCLECEVRFACNGECPKHRFVKTPDGEEGLNYLCPAYRKFFNHITPYMRFIIRELKQRRDAAGVMQWAKEKDHGFPSLQPGRNDPCPCGSGKKFKKCCGRERTTLNPRLRD